MTKPSDYELKLLRPLWRNGRMSAREIHEASQGETQWSFSATRKTLDRMLEKDIIRLELVHGLKTYVASRSKLDMLATLVTAFARDVLESDIPMPAAAFAGSRLVSVDEIAELETLLDQLAAKPDEEEPS